MNYTTQSAATAKLINYFATNREKEVMNLMCEGKTDVEIANILYLSPYTINTHRKNLMQKFNAKNSCQLIYLACTNGVI